VRTGKNQPIVVIEDFWVESYQSGPIARECVFSWLSRDRPFEAWPSLKNFRMKLMNGESPFPCSIRPSLCGNFGQKCIGGGEFATNSRFLSHRIFGKETDARKQCLM
jgi:hypothetical protein